MNWTDAILWLIILLTGLGTWLMRFSFILMFGWFRRIPPFLERALQYVPASVLAALALPPMFYLNDSLALSLTNDRLWAGSIAALVAWKTDSMLATIIVGMCALWSFRYVLSL